MPEPGTDTYTVFEAEHSGYQRNEIDGDGLRTLLAYDDAVTGRDALAAALTAAGYKDGALVTGLFEDDELDEYIAALNDIGVTCAARSRDTEDDEADEDEDTDTADDEEAPADVYQLLLTRDLTYDEEAFQELRELREEDMGAFQAELGHFLGYPEDDVEAFAANETALYLDRSGYLERTQPTDDYKVTDEDLRMALTFYAPRRENADHGEALRRGRTRYNVFQALDQLYDTDLADRAETYAQRRRTDDWVSDPQIIDWMREFARERRDEEE